MWLRTGGKWLCSTIVRMISLLYLCTRKGRIISKQAEIYVYLGNIRFKGGFLCSPEHSKVCFLLHETPFAAQNSLLCRWLWLSSEVGLPIHTCRKSSE